jgi:transposase InsO family protein
LRFGLDFEKWGTSTGKPSSYDEEATIDKFSRRVLVGRVSITVEVAPCIEALDDAMVRHGTPDNFNTDQGSQFTSAALPVPIHSGYRHEHGGKILA